MAQRLNQPPCVQDSRWAFPTLLSEHPCIDNSILSEKYEEDTSECVQPVSCAQFGTGPDSTPSVRADSSDLGSVMLAFSYLTNTSYALELIDIILHHFQPDNLRSMTWPETYTPTKEEFVEHLHLQGTLCKTALYCGTNTFSSILIYYPHHLREQTTQKLAPHLDQILAWSDYFQTAASLSRTPALPFILAIQQKPANCFGGYSVSNTAGLT